MPVIRFVREGRDVECYPGENLREVALREGIELYGLKGKLGNCGGCGQCITCFVDVVPAGSAVALSPRTGVEDRKLIRRPQTWRLACQALVEHSVLVVTRPQAGEAGLAPLLEGALPAPCRRDPPPGPSPRPPRRTFPQRRISLGLPGRSRAATSHPQRAHPQRAMKLATKPPSSGDTVPAEPRSPTPSSPWKPTISALSPVCCSFWFRPGS